MDIKPPQKRPLNPVAVPTPPVQPIPAPELPPIAEAPKKKSKLKKVLLFSGLGLLVAIIGVLVAAWFWYQTQLSAVDKDSQDLVLVNVVSGSTPTQIAELLEEKAVIRSSTAFGIYTRFTDTQNSLQAGSYRLSPADSTPQIVDHLLNGNVDTFRLTLYPGATLVDNTDTPDERKFDVTTALTRAGYGKEEIAAALSKTYEHPVFQDKPAGTSLEGYVYGETYEFNSGATVEDVLLRTFDELYAVVQNNDLIAKFQAQGFNLYQGITLASIIQRESGGDDKAQIAQVFLKRYREGMVLGSDVTYQYIADRDGLQRDPNLESDYNTRRVAGLTPTPIAAPGLASLLAVANPAEGDYLFFLSGDDNITYFARTLEEHEANIVNHCQQKCQIL